jgi:hypothetical protein
MPFVELGEYMHSLTGAVRQLYIKLGAANRAAAVRSATKLGLLTDEPNSKPHWL